MDIMKKKIKFVWLKFKNNLYEENTLPFSFISFS